MVSQVHDCQAIGKLRRVLGAARELRIQLETMLTYVPGFWSWKGLKETVLTLMLADCRW